MSERVQLSGALAPGQRHQSPPPMDTPRVTVVLVTWNRRRELETALRSVYTQTLAPHGLETIVVDNGSTDGTVEWLRSDPRFPVRLYAYPENRGASHARNAAIRLARAPHICFLDSDAEILSPHALEACLDALRPPRLRAVTASIWMDRARRHVFARGGYITPEGHFSGPRTRTQTRNPHFISTCFAVWEKSLLEELRGFDPWYFWGIEDMDLALRARWNARHRRHRGATRFRVLRRLHVLHEMSPGGRHYQPGDFEASFRAYERQRLYLVLAYGGIGAFLRVIATSPFHLRRIEREAWEQRLRWRHRLDALVRYPALRLVRLPWDLASIRRDHLARTPMPELVARG